MLQNNHDDSSSADDAVEAQEKKWLFPNLDRVEGVQNGLAVSIPCNRDKH